MADQKSQSVSVPEVKSAFDVLSNELSRIAIEIEDLPECGCQEMNNESIMRLQKIDFCSQRLQDLSTLINSLSNEFAVEPSGLSERLSEKARLEHTRDLFAGWVEV